MQRLAGKAALITGGSSGIGLATARLFVEEGACVALVGRSAGRGQEALDSLGAGSRAIFLAGDVRSGADCRRAVQATVEAFGRLDVLFNNAGVIYVPYTVLDTEEDVWDETVDSNLKGSYLMSRAAIPEMVKGGGGAIVHNASVFGLVGGMGAAAYCAAKGGVVLLTRAMALDHAAQNIRVNCVCPGSVDTPMLRDEMQALGGEEKMRPAFAARHPMNRISAPEEVARAVLYLASEESSFVTGIALPVDGGRSAW